MVEDFFNAYCALTTVKCVRFHRCGTFGLCDSVLGVIQQTWESPGPKVDQLRGLGELSGVLVTSGGFAIEFRRS